MLVPVHRWLGLFTAAFLFVAGLTGAVISWDHELDAWLNPHLYFADGAGTRQAPLDLAARLEATTPGVLVTYLPLEVERGGALLMSVEPNPVGLRNGAPPPAYNQVALDPANGSVQGHRWWGEASLSRENLLPFLYKLHYSMHIPDYRGVEVGVWFMGAVGILWLVDCFVALTVSFPSPRQWRKSFALRLRAGGFRLLFDLHRSGGVWLWLLILVLATTSVSMNLGDEVVRPLVSRVSTLSASPFDARVLSEPVAPAIGRAVIVDRARRDAPDYGVTAPAGAVFYSPDYGVYGVGFFEPGREHGDGGLGNPWLYYDARTGRPMRADIPGSGSVGDVFMQAQFPLHSGRIAGLPGRILVSVLGLGVAILALTGVVIWARKRASRRSARGLASGAPDGGLASAT